MLKDIFPQNAVDLGIIKQGGFLHSYFKTKEKLLYNISDFIGCMSKANMEYILAITILKRKLKFVQIQLILLKEKQFFKRRCF